MSVSNHTFIFNDSIENLIPAVKSALSNYENTFNDIIPCVTTKEKGKHKLYGFSIHGEAEAQYESNTNIPTIYLSQTEEELDLRQEFLAMDSKKIHELLARQGKQLPISEDVIKASLGFSVGQFFYKLAFYGNENKKFKGLFNLEGAGTVKGNLSEESIFKNSIKEARKKSIKAGADPKGVFTLIAPLEYEDFFKENVPDSKGDSLEEWLFERYKIIVEFKEETPNQKMVLFQDTQGNVYFQRDKNISFEERKDYNSTDTRWFCIFNLVGLVVKKEDQIIYIEDGEEEKVKMFSSKESKKEEKIKKAKNKISNKKNKEVIQTPFTLEEEKEI